MKLKSSYLYQLNEAKRPIGVYYIVIVSLMILVLLLNLFIPEANGTYQMSEMVSGIFLFVLGLNAFKDPFRLFIQSGISRKTLFAGRLLVTLSVATAMALIDKLVIPFVSFLVLKNEIHFDGAFEALYSQTYGEVAQGSIRPLGILFCILLDMLAVAGGFFITAAYYRMNKPAKIAVSVSVPMFLWIGLPIIETTVTNGAITMAILHFFTFAMGIKSGNPWAGILTLFISFAVFSGLAWLFIRRATLKGA